MTSVLALIVTLGVLITAHEYGHYWVARRCGVKVLRFSIGFGRPLWRWRQGDRETEFVVAAVPLGGYVRMLDEREGEVAPQEVHRAFNRKPVGQRIAVVAAGPLANLLFAVLAYALMYGIGVPGLRPLLDAPAPTSVAEQAGVRAGDEVLAVAGRPVLTLEELGLALLDGVLDGDEVALTVRDEEGRERNRVLQIPADTEAGPRLLAQLGLVPWRPALPAVLGGVAPDGAAAAAGLQAGDRVLRADAADIDDWAALASYVRARPGQAIELSVERAGQRRVVTITPASVEGQGLIGVHADVPPGFADERRIVVRYGPLEALWRGAEKTADMALFTLRMLGRMLVGSASLDNVSGPITIAQFAGESASVGGVAFLSFLALVSVSLAVLNLLPIPVLDGGHLLFYAYEAVRGKPLSEAAQGLGQRIGLALLLMLMGLALFNDLNRVLG